MPDESRRLWEIRIGVYTTEADAHRLADEFAAVLCPDPDHAPPCPVPWMVGVADGEDPVYDHLREQAAIEGRV